MKINKIYISAFGGLKDFTLELTDGLNVIYGNNEDGKSTVAAFIKAMFFGTGRSSKNLADSIRQKYTPWNDAAMAGRIYFENNNSRYCLEREFRKSDSTDRILLTDLDSGKQINIGENVGQQFFGISAAAFERSLFIGNADFIKDDVAAGEINGKLSNIAVTGSEDISYKKIEKNILDARTKLISKSGRSGSYNDDLQQLSALELRLENADRDARSKAALHEDAATRLREHEGLVKAQEKLKAILGLKQDFENREKLTDFLNTKSKLDALNTSLTLSDGTVVNEAFAQKVEFCISKYQKSADRCLEITNDIAKINESIELQKQASPEDIKAQTDALTSRVNELSKEKEIAVDNETKNNLRVDKISQNLLELQNKKSVVNIPLLVISVISACIGIAVTFITKPIAAIAFYIISAALIALSFIIKPKNKSAINALQNELTAAKGAVAEAVVTKNRILEEINSINARISTLSSVLHADAVVKAQQAANINEKRELLNTEREKQNDALNELLSLVSPFDVDDVEKAVILCEQLKQKAEEQKALKLQLKTASQYLGNIDYADAKAKLDAINSTAEFEKIDFDKTEAEYQSISKQISLLKDSITAIATELKTSFKNSENPEELKRQIAELQEKINSKKHFCDSADIALNVLQESFYELRRGYGSELEKLTRDIFYKLTNGKYKNVSINDTLDISVEKSDVFGTREIGYLSLGTTHQAYLSLRLAIATLISEDNTMPIFLDDALSQYDDTRTENAIKYLIDFCQSGQGVLFTCHKAVCEIAQKQGVKILKPYGKNEN